MKSISISKIKAFLSENLQTPKGKIINKFIFAFGKGDLDIKYQNHFKIFFFSFYF